MQVGDRVMYSKAFCRSCGLYASNDPLVHRTKGGEITSLTSFGQKGILMAHIQDAEGNTRKVLTSNLVLTTALEPER